MTQLHLFLDKRTKVAMDAADQSESSLTSSAYDVLQKRLMKLEVVPHTTQLCGSLFGPDDLESEDRYGDVASAQTISTYPTIPNCGRLGDPICDRFYIHLYEQTSIITLADGCSWGPKPREAAMLACNEIVSCMASRLHGCIHTWDIGCLLLKALMRAHGKILATKDACYDPGTTTVLAGVLAKLKEPADGKNWVFVCVSVGDCKAFYYSMKEHTFVDITAGNRLNLSDARDCGGRLGPADAEECAPDLRNLMSYYALLDDDDIVVAVSDGVHDNFDPQLRGIDPSDYGISASTW
eukprot:CAMPEP_0206160658 /NCGR_PEP_ID=MMETSP1474-20131121/6971_1 /ASSEMBLY_ACC=CAM_ASM_001110 /TAXON_ID=97495 /ORGANISM="Imantonia sp., Strain RCC918" /LENGTH=294 /DNA_ID=CAMNT_0053562131 /DNA_START=282 /DNA_END=1163 /DNA_ORIENTATION=-